MISVVIVDDHGMVREGLRQFLTEDPEITVVGEASDGASGVQLVQSLRPAVVLMDVMMPVLDGISATASLRHCCPESRVIILSNHVERSTVIHAVKAGAVGYLLKDALAEELCHAIKEVVQGNVHFAPQASIFLLREVREPNLPENLTEREADVLRLLAQGRSNKDIARHLHIVEDTVKTHVRHILSKLGVQSRTQAALYATRLNLVPIDEQEQSLQSSQAR
jgi:NarL family two-component system response regulator LiaR